MKKLFLGIMPLLVSAALFAQDPKYGLKAGLNLSTITNNGSSMKPGVHVGAIAHIHATPAFSLQPEIYYSNQGAKISLVGSNADSRINLNYINVPILLQYNFHNGFRLQGGPQIGFLIEAKNKTGNLETNVASVYKTADFSIPVGLSYLDYSGFGLDMRYNIGVTNVVKNSSTSYRNSVLQLGVFYLFDHHHKATSSKRR